MPSALVHTAVFEDIRTAFARGLGAAGYPAVVVPHPMATRSVPQLQRIAGEALPRVEELLTGSGIAARYIV